MGKARLWCAATLLTSLLMASTLLIRKNHAKAGRREDGRGQVAVGQKNVHLTRVKLWVPIFDRKPGGWGYAGFIYQVTPRFLEGYRLEPNWWCGAETGCFFFLGGGFCFPRAGFLFVFWRGLVWREAKGTAGFICGIALF